MVNKLPGGVRATVALAADVPYPRKRPVSSGYRPQIKFAWTEESSSGELSFDDAESHAVGDTWQAEIRILGWAYLGDRVRVGDTFEMCEDSHLVGRGVVDELLQEQ